MAMEIRHTELMDLNGSKNYEGRSQEVQLLENSVPENGVSSWSSKEIIHVEREMNRNLEETISSEFPVSSETDISILDRDTNLLNSPLSDTEVEEVKRHERPTNRFSRGWRTWFSRTSKPQLALENLKEITIENAKSDLSSSPEDIQRSRSVEDVR
jgi:hypothetical protein